MRGLAVFKVLKWSQRVQISQSIDCQRLSHCRNLLHSRFCISPQRCHLSTKYKYFNVRNAVSKGAVILEMNHGSVNAMSPGFMKEFCSVLEDLDGDDTCHGIIVTSASSVFCAGLDITELHQPQKDRVHDMWKYVQDTLLLLRGTKKATVAAINGTAVAGGCILTLCCDYRVLADGKHKMGMQAARLGIVVPDWLQKIVCDTVGSRQADLMLQRALLFNPQEALDIGLVDKVVPQRSLIEEADKVMETFLAIPDAGRHLTKQQLRKSFLESFEHFREKDVAFFVELVYKETSQKTIEQYVKSLKKRS